MKKIGLPTFSYWNTATNTLIARVQHGSKAKMKRTNELIQKAGLPLAWKYDGIQPPIQKEEEYVDIDLS